MLHYTCDRCKRSLHSSADVRYQIKIDVQCIGASDDVDSLTDDSDALSELHQLLDGLQSDEATPMTSCAVQTHYDLCEDCYRHFARNPLGRELAVAIGFSNN